MTLIINFLCRDFAVQVSDRRLTYRTPQGRTAVHSDSAVKATLWNGRVSFAYTGLARIGHRPTDQWLARTLGAANTLNLREACEFLAKRSTEEFRRIYVSKSLKAHCFAGVGWTDSFGGELLPIQVAISNMFLPDGRIAREPQRDFQVQHLVLEAPTVFGFSSFGQQMTKKEASGVKRSIVRILGRGGCLEDVCWLLCCAVWDKASSNRTIGNELLLCSLPRVAAKSALATGVYTLTAGGAADQNTFVHLRSRQLPPEQIGPHFVSKGTVLTGLKGGSLQPEGHQVSTRN